MCVLGELSERLAVRGRRSALSWRASSVTQRADRGQLRSCCSRALRRLHRALPARCLRKILSPHLSCPNRALQLPKANYHRAPSDPRGALGIARPAATHGRRRRARREGGPSGARGREPGVVRGGARDAAARLNAVQFCGRLAQSRKRPAEDPRRGRLRVDGDVRCEEVCHEAEQRLRRLGSL